MAMFSWFNAPNYAMWLHLKWGAGIRMYVMMTLVKVQQFMNPESMEQIQACM